MRGPEVAEDLVHAVMQGTKLGVSVGREQSCVINGERGGREKGGGVNVMRDEVVRMMTAYHWDLHLRRHDVLLRMRRWFPGKRARKRLPISKEDAQRQKKQMRTPVTTTTPLPLWVFV